VWLKDRRPKLYVEASVNSATGRISAQVDAELTGMTVTAPTADDAECLGSGVPYAPGATGECVMRFRAASPGVSMTPVSVKTHWHTSWSANGIPQGDTPQQLDPTPMTTNIRVLEVQTVTR
jgi:hypothetical protein